MDRKCVFCDSSSVAAFENTPFVRCNRCGLFINKPMSEEAMKNKNKNFLLSTCHKPNPGFNRIKEAHEVQLTTLEKYIKPGAVYDVGAASGFFMKAAVDRGWESYGNEISIQAIKWAKNHYDIDVDYGFLEELDTQSGYFNAVVLWNTLEHTHNPNTTLKICYRMLKKGGLIYIKVPNKKTVQELMRHYEIVHLFEFTDECLCMHLENMGFEEVWKETNDINPRSGVRAGIYLHRKI